MAGKTMVERVARALALPDNGAPPTWRLYEGDAKVAIGALQNATDMVLEAGGVSRERWERMIEAALTS